MLQGLSWCPPGGWGEVGLAQLSSVSPVPQSPDSVPPGYEPISLLEALNGLRAVSPALPSAPLYEEVTSSAGSDGLSQASCPHTGLERLAESSLQTAPRTTSPDR